VQGVQENILLQRNLIDDHYSTLEENSGCGEDFAEEEYFARES